MTGDDNLPRHDRVVWILCNRIKMDAKCDRSPSRMRKMSVRIACCVKTKDTHPATGKDSWRTDEGCESWLWRRVRRVADKQVSRLLLFSPHTQELYKASLDYILFKAKMS